MTSFKLTDFRASLSKKNGVARPNKYFVLIEAPALNGDKEFLSFACINAQLPGRSFRTTEQMIYSVARKFPYAVLYDDLSLTFMCSNSMDEKKTFDTWQRQIISPTNQILNYYDSYVGQILIMTIDDEGNPSYVCYCEEAWPVSVEPADLSYEENDTFLRLNVRFAYRKWTSYEDRVVDPDTSGTAIIPEVKREFFTIKNPITGSDVQISIPANLIGASDLFSSVKSLLPPNVFKFDFGSVPFVGDFFRNFTPARSLLKIF